MFLSTDSVECSPGDDDAKVPDVASNPNSTCSDWSDQRRSVDLVEGMADLTTTADSGFAIWSTSSNLTFVSLMC